MLYTERMQRAIRFMVKTHEVYQKQKRKGKDVPYLTHPLTVGMILARAGASEDLVIAGILHDTIEDSIEEKKVSHDMLVERFGDRVAALVMSVTEDKALRWGPRKEQARAEIASYGHDEVLLKSADVIANNAELLEDHAVSGDAVFEHFTAPKEETLAHHFGVIEALLSRWPESPLAGDLTYIADLLAKIQ